MSYSFLQLYFLAHVGELEALRTHYESISQELQSQVQSLTEKLEYVQNERDKVKSSHEMSSDESTQRIKTLEKVLLSVLHC